MCHTLTKRLYICGKRGAVTSLFVAENSLTLALQGVTDLWSFSPLAMGYGYLAMGYLAMGYLAIAYLAMG